MKQKCDVLDNIKKLNMMTIDKLLHGNKYQLVKLHYDKYENDDYRIANSQSHLPIQNWEAYVKSKRNNDFEASPFYDVSSYHFYVYVSFVGQLALPNELLNYFLYCIANG